MVTIAQSLFYTNHNKLFYASVGNYRNYSNTPRGEKSAVIENVENTVA